MAIESSFIPFPSEVVIPPAAYFAARNGDMNIIMIVVVGTLGALIGAIINYVLSLLIGRPVVYAFANSRIGHMCLIDAEKVQKAEVYFDRHGAISTFLGRLIPAWNVVLAGLGYWLSLHFPEQELLEQLEHYNRYLSWAGYALAIFIVLFLAYQAIKKKPATISQEPKNDNK